MINACKAPVAQDDVGVIVDYLSGITSPEVGHALVIALIF
jgi:hypothetical protein